MKDLTTTIGNDRLTIPAHIWRAFAGETETESATAAEAGLTPKDKSLSEKLAKHLIAKGNPQRTDEGLETDPNVTARARASFRQRVLDGD
ncbi:MAG TPA: hypothetical protein VHC22_17895 [Pirellulales bacterium]|nr:hypothetical protein [Pirellulales bacterium]